jgi:hypothetical protein
MSKFDDKNNQHTIIFINYFIIPPPKIHVFGKNIIVIRIRIMSIFYLSRD